MAKERKYHPSKFQDFFDYSEGNMSEKERNAFERNMQKDPFAADAAEGFSKVSREEASADMERISEALKKRTRHRNRIMWYSAAASIAALAIVATLFFTVDDGSMERYKAIPELQEAVSEKKTSTETKSGQKTSSDDTRVAMDDQGNEQENESPAASPSSEEMTIINDDAPIENNDADAFRAERKKDLIPEIREITPPEEEVSLDEIEAEAMIESKTEDDAVAIFMDEASENEEVIAPQPMQSVLRENTDKAMQAQPKTESADLAYSKKSIPPPEAGKVLSRATYSAALMDTTMHQVSGIIRSAEDLQPLPGVTVFMKGTDVGTVTDLEGNFALNTAGIRESTLVASYIGMETEEFRLDTAQTMEIAMVPDNLSLDEVVVVGYANEKTVHTVGAVTEMDADDLSPSEYQSGFPGSGMADYKQYIDTALVYPQSEDASEKAVVVLKFRITRYGRPWDFKVIRSPSPAYTDEAIRVIKDGPDWKPAKRDGAYTEDPVRLRIVFRPE